MQVLNGFVKIHRKLLQWGWYQDNVVKGVFLHLLLTAAFKDSQWMGRTIKRGQVVVGVQKMADELGFTRQQVRTAINKLKSTNEITTETTNKYTIVTVVNWEEYQLFDEIPTNKITNILTNEQPTNNQQITNKQPHRKNVKNVKNVKKCVGDNPTTHTQSQKISFAEFVSLTYEEHKKLVDKFGEADTKRMIEILDNYKGSNGKKYRSDYRAILSWVTDRLKKEKQSQHDNMKIDTFNHSELEKLTRG